MKRRSTSRQTTKRRVTLMLAKDVADTLDRLAGDPDQRGPVVERAVRALALRDSRRTRDDHDLEVLNRNAERLGREAEDVLAFQMAIWP